MYRLVKRERKNGRVEFVIQRMLDDVKLADLRIYDNLVDAEYKYKQYQHKQRYAEGHAILGETVIA